LRRGRVSARELLGKPRVQPLALPGQDRLVDGLCEQRVAEAVVARRALGNEHAVLNGSSQQLARVALRHSGGSANERVADVASGGGGQAKDAPSPVIELPNALQQHLT